MDTQAIDTKAAKAAKGDKGGKGKAAKGGKAPQQAAGATPVLFAGFEPTPVRLPRSGWANGKANTTRPGGFAEADIAAFADFIAGTGFVLPEPISLVRAGDGFDLASGYRRTAAIDLLIAQGRVPADHLWDARVVVVPEGADAELIRAAENVRENVALGEDVGWRGRAAGFDTLYRALIAAGTAEAKATEAVARLTGRAEDFVRDHLRFANGKAHPDLVIAMSRPEADPAHVSWGVGRLAARLPKAQQESLLPKLYGRTVVEATELIRAERAGEQAPAPTKGGKAEKAPEDGAPAEKGLTPARVAKALVGKLMKAAAHATTAADTAADDEDREKAAEACAAAIDKAVNALLKLVGDTAFEEAAASVGSGEE